MVAKTIYTRKMDNLRRSERDGKMRKLLSVASVLLLLAVFLTPMIVHGQAGPSFAYVWRGATYTGNDPFYNATVYAYGENTTAILSITIKADTAQLNVSNVRVVFDWENGIYNGTHGDRAISAENLLIIPPQVSRIVGISFTVPPTSIASNMYLHSYTIIVEHLNSTSPPTQMLEPITKFASDFAVYSEDQADARDLYVRVQTVKTPTAKFNSSRAKIFVYKAENETSTGDMYYTQGDFGGAESHYNAALDLYSSAYVAEETFSVTSEDLQIKLIEAQIRNVESSASMVFSSGIALTLFGVTAVLFGIGYIIKQLAVLKKAGQKAATA